MVAEPRVLVLGSEGMLGTKVIARRPTGVEILGADREQLDIRDPSAVSAYVEEHRPGTIVNCAAYTNVDGCEEEVELSHAVNGAGAGHLADAARATGARLLHISTDYVFDGRGGAPYAESAPTNPINEYGRSKLAGEEAILARAPELAWILRTSWLYGAGGPHFPATIARLAGEREELSVVDDQHGRPTWTTDLADAIWRTVGRAGAEALEPGTYHVCGGGECTWYDLATAVVEGLRARGAELAVGAIHRVTTEAFPRPAARPADARLSTEKYERATGTGLRPWRDALDAYLDGEGAEELGLGPRSRREDRTEGDS